MICKSNIQDWQESFSLIDENKFFNIIRMYLGEIKTPYNRQRLIEQLASYLKNENNLNILIGLLDQLDLKVLTAICFINNPTRQNLIDFFAGEYTMAEIYTELSSLTQRLLIFDKKDPYENKFLYYVNPLIWNKLSDYIGIQNILIEPKLEKENKQDTFSLDSNFLCSFISFLNHYGCSCKADGVIKKTDQNKVEQIFPGKKECFQLLINAFINLNLIKETEKNLQVDYQRLEIFSKIEEPFQYSYICAASCSRFSREGLKKEAQIFLDVLNSIPKSGYTKSTIVKLAFLVGTQFSENNSSSKSRFSQILEAARQEKKSFISEHSGLIIERMLDSAIELGFLRVLGKDNQGNDIFVPGIQFQKENEDTLKVLNIDSTFTVTILPGLKLMNSLSLSKFLQIKRVGLVSEYEINRNSVSFAFDSGLTSENIIEVLKFFVQYSIPQNLLITIADWYNVYSSAIIYKGYVLKVCDSNIQFVEKNPRIINHIKEKLGNGIYLLDIPINQDINIFAEESGLEFMGKVRSGEELPKLIDFPNLRKGNSVCFEKKQVKEINYSKALEYINSLKERLQKLELDEIQIKTLTDKINQRVIINENQLSLSHISTEVLEASGTDYSGKIHLIEAAINAQEEMEIILPQFNNQSVYFTMIGKPLSLTKQTSDAIVRVEFMPDHNIENLVVSKITHLRRLRF